MKNDENESKKPYTLLTMLRNVLIFATIILGIYFLSPFEAVTISGSSMEPTLPVGSVAIAVKADMDTDYHVGDIITFECEYDGNYYSRVAHRIVAINEDGTIQTKGDHNPEPDPFTITPAQIHNIIRWVSTFTIL